MPNLLYDDYRPVDGVKVQRLVSVGGLAGLAGVRVTGEANERETEATHYVEHRFEVHYHQATA